MNKDLSIDEFDALEQISRLSKNVKPTACVNRNAKRLCGIKLASYRKDGQLELTEQGNAALFAKQCIDGLRAVQSNPQAQLSADVAAFLGKKSYISSSPEGTQISQRGLECLADIDAQRK
ncbi:hypothetical protein [Solimicrobium silvestre]|uniref:Uncharacterized protein n=1 Tax=Solimicrobium silvestre TaxID=2099400 RepID=A0A2S9GX65_9BURK|nr:hypothetical protein [Solimicrobium silvestre]PRC92256.1 hypothetical protein S2091_2915 [Solimicrobium silvestre]